LQRITRAESIIEKSICEPQKNPGQSRGDNLLALHSWPGQDALRSHNILAAICLKPFFPFMSGILSAKNLLNILAQ
jgi:hypothetical protein